MMVADDLYSNEKYMVLAKKYKEGTRARRMIDELNSNLGRVDICCNPECRKILGKKSNMFMAFDGIFCSEECKNAVHCEISIDWYALFSE